MELSASAPCTSTVKPTQPLRQQQQQQQQQHQTPPPPFDTSIHVSSASSSSRSAHTSSAESAQPSNVNTASSSSTSPLLKSAKMRVAYSDLDDTSSVGSNDALNAPKVHIKSAISSPRSSVSSSGAVRRGGWRGVGAATSASTSRSFTHAHRGETYASSSSSELGADEPLPLSSSGNAHVQPNSPLWAPSPPPPDTCQHDVQELEQRYSDNPHELSVADHPAWHKLRAQPGLPAPGILSYLPSVSQDVSHDYAQDPRDDPSESRLIGSTLLNPHDPPSSHRFPDTTSSAAHQASASTATQLAPSRNACPRQHITLESIDDDYNAPLPSVEPGAYDWANFVYAYARGRWNPGLIPQPPGQSTAFPGTHTRINSTRHPTPDATSSATNVLSKRRPSLEYVMPDSALPTTKAAPISTAPTHQLCSLPLSARGSADSDTAVPLPLDTSADASAVLNGETSLPSHSLQYIHSSESDQHVSSQNASASTTVESERSSNTVGNLIDANVLTALRLPPMSMSSVSRKSTCVARGADLDFDGLSSPHNSPDDAQPPQRAKTAPEGLPTSVAQALLPSQLDHKGLASAAQLVTPPPAAQPRQYSDTLLQHVVPDTLSLRKSILKDEPNKPVVRTPISELSDPLHRATPHKDKTNLANDAVSLMLNSNAQDAVVTPSARPQSKLAGDMAESVISTAILAPADSAHNDFFESEPLERPGPTPIQSTHGVPKHPVVWQSAPEGLSSFAEAMSRQASGTGAADAKSALFNEIAIDNVTVAGLRRAARRTSMERSVAELDRICSDACRNPKGPLVSHSASFPGSTPRPSKSAAAGGPHEGVQPLPHLFGSSTSVSASTNNGPTVNVAHFVRGKQSGETRIDLRGTITSSPATNAKDVNFAPPSTGQLPYEVSAHDVSLAANASTTKNRPAMTNTSSQRIQSYLAAGKRVELFYRDFGYLPSILPPHEEVRLHALSRYGPPKIAGNPNFERLAHLVKLVFNSKLVLITLVGENEQIFQTQMGGGGEITIASLQAIAGSRNCSFCSHAILQDSDEPIVILDAAKDWRFSGNPLVQGSPDIRFYAGSPLRTSDGLNIGSLCLIDDKPRTDFGPRQRHTLREFSRVVMREMELLRDKIQFGMRDRMQRSVELFTKECLEMDSEDGETEAVASAHATIGTHKVFQLAAQSMREALQASGAVIFDLSHFELIDSYEDDFVPSELGNGTSSKVYFANPSSSHDIDPAASASGSADDRFGSDSEGNSAADVPTTPHGKTAARDRYFDGTSGVETFKSPLHSPKDDQSARAKRVPPMSVLGTSEADGVPPERGEFVPLSHHVQMAEFLRVHRTGKFYSYAPPPFRSLLPHGVTGLLLVPIFGLNKQPFALLCAYITSSERSIALEELQVSGLQYLRALGMIVLSAILKKDIMLADKAKSNFISNISHELRTPLHGILAAAELLAETKLNATQGSYLETVEACGKSLLELVNHVLDFTKLSGNTRSGKRSIQTKTKCDMVKLIQEVCESSWIGQIARQVETASSGIGSVYAPPEASESGASMVQARARAARDHKVETVIDIALRENGWLVNCDTGGIRRVLMNLIGNSLKFTSAGFVHVSLREVQSSKTHIMIELSVTDTGRGISRAFLEEQLFHPFTQENPHGTGTGLGLSIVNSIVQSPSMNGKIDVWSTEGEGTEIRVTCELELCEDDDIEGPTYKPAVNVHQAYTVALLGFDESRGDQDLRLALQGYFLNWWEFKLCELDNVDDQIKKSDVVVINDDMALLERVKGERKGELPPVIFLTASRGESEIAMACEAYHASGGVARILFKPAGPAKLESVVDFCLQCLERKLSGENVSSEETKPSTPLPSPSEAGGAYQQMEQADSYFSPRPSRPDIHSHLGHEIGSFDTNASITPRAEGETRVPVTSMAQDAQSTSGQKGPKLADGEIGEMRRPTLDAGIDRNRSHYMSPDPPGSSSNSLIRRHSTEARMDAGNEDASSSMTAKPSRPLLPARSITYHEPRLHKHVLMSPMGGREVDGDSYFERAPTPNAPHTPNTPGSTVSLEGGDGAVLKSVLASSRGGSSLSTGGGGGGTSRKRMQILSVEDNAINRKVIAAFLAKLEVDFVEATNGEEGIAQFSRYPPNHFDVILMDLSMPVMDGISAIAAIRKIELERYQGGKSDSGSSGNNSSSTHTIGSLGRTGTNKLVARQRSKIFALTGRSTDEDKRQAFQTGADGYIVKPLSFKVLSSLLRMLMR